MPVLADAYSTLLFNLSQYLIVDHYDGETLHERPGLPTLRERAPNFNQEQPMRHQGSWSVYE